MKPYLSSLTDVSKNFHPQNRANRLEGAFLREKPNLITDFGFVY